MPVEKILITVKTYPTLSRAYGETVCTAGVREDGTWVRIYPVPFRRLGYEQQYKKYQWIECDLILNPKDKRPETRRPVSESFQALGELGTKDEWRERRRLLTGGPGVFERLDPLLEQAKNLEISLAVYRPTEVLDLVVKEEAEREWDEKRIEEMRQLYSQHDLFDDNSWRETFRVIPKLPYSFSYRFRDADGRESTLQILDWEIGALFANCRSRANGDEKVAVEMVKRKYFDEFTSKDLHFVLGTRLTHQMKNAPNPWSIVSVLPFPHIKQVSLF